MGPYLKKWNIKYRKKCGKDEKNAQGNTVRIYILILFELEMQENARMSFDNYIAQSSLQPKNYSW